MADHERARKPRINFAVERAPLGPCRSAVPRPIEREIGHNQLTGTSQLTIPNNNNLASTERSPVVMRVNGALDASASRPGRMCRFILLARHDVRRPNACSASTQHLDGMLALPLLAQCVSPDLAAIIFRDLPDEKDALWCLEVAD